MSYLEIKNLQKKYTKDGPLVVNNMNLSIEKGEFIVFLGPSGCGKTTTIRMISGLEDISGGEILIDGEDVIGKKPKDRGVSMIFQSYAIWPHMTVFDNIAYPLKLQKVPKDEIKKRVTAAAEATDIVGLLNRYPAQMSGGQRQRVAVSRAIVVKPKIFLMDEPLSNLDAKLRVEMRNAIKRIQQQFGITTVYVTHDQEEALAVSDRIAVMDGGVIQQIDTPQRVYQRPANRFVSNFIGLSNFLNATVSRGGDGAELCFAGSDYRAAMTNLRGEASDGMDVLAAVRPEEFLLSTGEGEGIPATVRSSVFLGTTTHYFLTLPTGQEIEAVRDSDEEWAVIPDGAEVRLRVKPRRINVFTADGKRSLVIREELL